MKKKWNIRPFITLIIYAIFGIVYLVYTNIPKTFYVDNTENFWNEFKQHQNFSDFKYKKSTIIFTGNVDLIELYENSNDCYVLFYFENGSYNSKNKYANAILVKMDGSQLSFKEHDKVKLKAEYDLSSTTETGTDIFLKNGIVMEEP